MSKYGEPWSLLDHGGAGAKYSLQDASGGELLAAEEWFSKEPEAETIARVAKVGYADRIVACVNACAGIPSPSGIPGLIAAVGKIVQAGIEAKSHGWEDHTNFTQTLETAMEACYLTPPTDSVP